MSYAELHCVSNFSFLRGASHPEELVTRAHELGYAALAITDECSLAGVVRAHVEARKCGLPLIIGSEFRLDDGLRLLPRATCTCTRASGARCRIRSPRSASRPRSRKQDTRSFPTANVTCARSIRCAVFIRRRGSRKRWPSPGAASFLWRNCATNIPRKSCRRARRRPRTCAG